MNEIANHLDSLDEHAALRALLKCCASGAWADGMLRHRPFGTDDRLFTLAEELWSGLAPTDHLEAFAGHPRIGDRAGPEHSATADWSRREQSGMEAADAEVAQALAAENIRYERKFGHVFLICATGRSAAEMLDAIRARMENDPEAERRVAAMEHARITRLRLRKLIEP